MNSRHLYMYGIALLLVTFSGLSSAQDLPKRRPGLWEITLVQPDGSSLGNKTQQCTDATNDSKFIYAAMTDGGAHGCGKESSVKRGDSYVAESACPQGQKFRSVATGNFTSQYTVVSSLMARDGTLVSQFGRHEGKWLASCKAGQRAGEIFDPDGSKIGSIDEIFKYLPK